MKSVKLIKDQTNSEKIYVLKQVAHHMLGAKWKYFHKIKRGGEGLSLFKEKSLMEQMKATQSTSTVRRRSRSSRRQTVLATDKRKSGPLADHNPFGPRSAGLYLEK